MICTDIDRKCAKSPIRRLCNSNGRSLKSLHEIQRFFLILMSAIHQQGNTGNNKKNKDNNLKNALNRKYTVPLLFEGDNIEKNKLLKILKSFSLTMQEGGRVFNLGDNTNKVKSMNKVIKIYKKIEANIKIIGVGDNFNDLEMLKNCDIPCLVFNDKFTLDQINIDNLIVSNKPSPEGWADVIKMALGKLGYND